MKMPPNHGKGDERKGGLGRKYINEGDFTRKKENATDPSNPVEWHSKGNRGRGTATSGRRERIPGKTRG